MDTYKRLAETFLQSGRLIKTVNEYSIDKNKLQAFLSSPEADPNKKEILKNYVYIGFDQFLLMLMQSFAAFLRTKTPYVMVVKDDWGPRIKSNNWVVLLLLRYGQKMLRKIYYDPVDIVTIDCNFRPDNEKNYLLCDDFLFSGTQMDYNIQYFIPDYMRPGRRNYPTFKINIVCAGCTQRAQTRLSKYPPVTIYSTYDIKPICASDELLEYFDTLPQPFNVDRIVWKDNIPMYTEHKLPDAMSSFPQIIKCFISNCSWPKNSRVVDGSSAKTKCAHPFYKVEDLEKGASDFKNEEEFIGRLCRRLGRVQIGTGRRKRNLSFMF